MRRLKIMGWGTEFKYDIYLSRRVYRAKWEVEDDVKNVEKEVERTKEQILMFCSASPNTIVSEDYKDEAVNYIHREVSELFEFYEEQLLLLQNLKCYLEVYDEAKANERDD